tara:strand:- start:339 stop:887 length:549 start_codon:yes stop_codon:yes gene_type:complete
MDWSLEAGGALVLNGPNGSGKSSLLRVIAGLLAPSQGYVECQGEKVHKAEDYRMVMHYVGHLNPLKPVFSVYENVKFWSEFRGGEGVAGALKVFGLEDLRDVPSRLLSSGQKRRVILANLLTVSRKIWLLDEPSIGLDRESVAALVDAIELHRAKGGVVVAATHGELQLQEAATILLGEGPS